MMTYTITCLLIYHGFVIYSISGKNTYIVILVNGKELILINSCLDMLRVHANILVLDGLRRGSMVFPILSSSLPK